MGSHSSASRSAAPDDVRTAMDCIRRIVQELRIASRAAEKRFGLTAAQLFVLQKLGQARSRSLSLNELAARTLTHQSSVSVVVRRLVEAGMIRRQRSSQDGRQIDLSLTAAGRALLRRSPTAAQERLINALEDLPASDRAALAGLLSRVARQISPEREPPPLFFEDSKHSSRQDHASPQR